MLKIKNYFIFIIVALIVYPFISVAKNNINPEQNQIIIKQNAQSPVNGNEEPLLPVLTITPREINIGTITDDKSGEGIFTLKNMSLGVIDWWTDGPEGWEKSEKQKLSSVVKNNTDSLRIEIRLLTIKSL